MNEFRDIIDFGRWLIGKQVRIKKNMKIDTTTPAGVGFTYYMERYAGNIYTVRQFRETRGNYVIFKLEGIDDYVFDTSMIDAVYCQKEFTVKEEIDVKAGDLIALKNKEELEDKDYDECVGNYAGIPIYETISVDNINVNIEEFTDERFVVLEKTKHNIVVMNVKNNKLQVFAFGMVKITEKNYITNLKEKEKIKAKEKRLIETFDIIHEMKDKVNIKDFKKIYAGSLTKIPKELKGVEVLLYQWALAKKEIYKMLGRNLNIEKEIEYQMDASAITEAKEVLIKEFPRLLACD